MITTMNFSEWCRSEYARRAYVADEVQRRRLAAEEAQKDAVCDAADIYKATMEEISLWQHEQNNRGRDV